MWDFFRAGRRATELARERERLLSGFAHRETEAEKTFRLSRLDHDQALEARRRQNKKRAR